MKVRPLHDRLIVQRLEEEEKTKGGIIIPDTAKEKPIEGKVIAVGAGRIKKDGTKVPLEVKKGDRVALLLPNSPQLILTQLGVWKAGGIAADEMDN